MTARSLAPDVRLRLRDGARIDRVADLASSVRERLASGDEELPDDAAVLSRPGARASVVQLDPDTAALLDAFGEVDGAGLTVAEAVLKLARARQLDAEELLEASLPVVGRLFGKGYLIDADAPPVKLGFQPGDEVGGWRVVRALARMEDSEAHLVRGTDSSVDAEGTAQGPWAVLKISTPDRSFGRTEHEAEILRHLEADHCPVVPRCLDEGEDPEGHHWIVVEYRPGIPLRSVVRGLHRRLEKGGGRRDVLSLCRVIAQAFSEVHRARFAHGDVHMDNVLVAGSEADPEVSIIDFGCAVRLDGSGETSSRPGNDYFREPELAAPILAGDRKPTPSTAGEQHAVAAMLFYVATGRHFLDFAVDSSEVLRQIAEDPPRSFEDAGVGPWPELEAVLGRALSKRPEDRFGSLEELAEALDAISGVPEGVPSKASTPTLDRQAVRVVAGARLAEDGAGWEESPHFFFGASGLAWSLLQVATRRSDPEMLALADLWATRAVRAVEADATEPAESAETEDPNDDPPTLPTAPWHGPAGVYEVAACVAFARGAQGLFRHHAGAFLAASKVEVPRELTDDRALDVDLALGRPGTLISTAHLMIRAEALRQEALHAELKEFGDAWLDDLWRRLDQHPDLSGDDAWLGFAHGWAGALYATLAWCREAGRDLPSGFAARVEQLAAESIPHGRGVRWPWHRSVSDAAARQSSDMPGWCHGSAGYALFFSTLASQPGFEAYGALAEAAAWDVWDRFVASPRQTSHLCCGLVGQAYSLLVRARDTGDESWRQRASAVAEAGARRGVYADGESEAGLEASAERMTFENALFKGRGALPALSADLASPIVAWPWLEDLDGPPGIEYRIDP